MGSGARRRRERRGVELGGKEGAASGELCEGETQQGWRRKVGRLGAQGRQVCLFFFCVDLIV